MTWIDEEIEVEASLLPEGTEINSNGAGDSFTCGLLIAAMIRHTGLCVPIEASSSPVKTLTKNPSFESDAGSISSSSSPKKLTPYSLYMRENYVALKQQSSDDQKTIFSRCHEMWEAETEENKQLYERRCREEIEKQEASTAADISSPLTPSPKKSNSEPDRNLHLANQPMNLETAAQFASLIAANHINMSTRDLTHLNINRIREQSSVSSHGLEEI